MTARLLFAHGWGFTPALWDAVAARLGGEHEFVDLGHFGPERIPAMADAGPIVVVGHSFGVLWLLERMALPVAGFVAVNGFPRFAEGGDFAPAVAPRLIDRMIRRLRSDPAGTVTEFRARAGAAAGRDLSAADTDRLGRDLEALRDWDGRAALAALDCPILVLAARDDAIVPAAMSAHAFAAARRGATMWSESGGHVLPLTRPDWCAERIADFLADIGA